MGKLGDCLARIRLGIRENRSLLDTIRWQIREKSLSCKSPK